MPGTVLVAGKMVEPGRGCRAQRLPGREREGRATKESRMR